MDKEFLSTISAGLSRSRESITKHEIQLHADEAVPLNRDLLHFLKIDNKDSMLLYENRRILKVGIEKFSSDFYQRLLSEHCSAASLNAFKERGGIMTDLEDKLSNQLFEFLEGRLDDGYAKKLFGIGIIHHKFGIEPAWIVGSYNLIRSHFSNLIEFSNNETSSYFRSVTDAVHKFIFRDMGLLLSGFWHANQTLALKASEEAIIAQDHLRNLVRNIPHIIWAVDIKDSELIFMSPRAVEISDTELTSPIPFVNLMHLQDRPRIENAWKVAKTGQYAKAEARLTLLDGSEQWYKVQFYPSFNEDREIRRVDCIMEDVSKEKKNIEYLDRIANTDKLTGLKNRSCFYRDLRTEICNLKANPNLESAILIVDIDNFKEVNDALGHSVGDQLLVTLSDLIQKQLKKEQIFSRIGGDEFALLIRRVRNGEKAAEEILLAIQESLERPLNINGIDIFLNISAGVSIFPAHGLDASTLMRRAAIAMNHAKKSDIYLHVYSADLDKTSKINFKLSSDLRYAIERNELELHYQPKVDLQSGQMTGVEALIRWNHPVYKLVYPDKFIALAEKTGVINLITEWVINESVKQNKEWHSLGYNLSMAVNVSARSFLNSDELIRTVSKAIKNHKLEAGSLEIEITEDILMSNIETVSKSLLRLSSMGVHIAIDDFGTGYSSLAYLNKLPIHHLKIDKSFIFNLESDNSNVTIVRSTIDMAHNLGLRVVAEGVENQKSLELVAEFGADIAQGYYFSRPQPSHKILDWCNEFNSNKPKMSVNEN